MMLPLPRRLSLLLAAVVPVALCAGTDGPVTIDQSDIYQQQRTCAFSCFKQFGDAGYPIAQQIACPTFKVQNKCFCRPDLQQDAHNYVFSCISTNCANALDISVATKLYDDYCTSNGWIVTTTTQAPQPSETGGSPPSSPPITSPPNKSETSRSIPPTPTTTSGTSSPGTGGQSSDSGSNSGGGEGGGTKLSAGELAGIIVGVVSAVATVIGVIFAWKTYKKDKTVTRAPEVSGLPGPNASGWR